MNQSIPESVVIEQDLDRFTSWEYHGPSDGGCRDHHDPSHSGNHRSIHDIQAMDFIKIQKNSDSRSKKKERKDNDASGKW